MNRDLMGVYSKSSNGRLFTKNSIDISYVYSDGMPESQLAQIIESATDLSTFSEELAGKMSNWVLEYHLSRKRHLLLRHLGINSKDRVLELGAGCGAITRYLGETGAEVVAVEGSPSRADIIASRCRDLGNVSVIVDLIQDLDNESIGNFDFVLLIGVLEYSTKYLADSKNAFQEYIKKASSLLKTNGKLVVAIENKLGLKYFNGATEDHNSIHYYGAEGLYKAGDATTLGKTELVNEINAAGMVCIDIFSVFPDYKLPRLLVRDVSDGCTYFRVEEIIAGIKSLDYSGYNHRLFNEALVFGELRKNGIFSHFANSHMIVACRSQIYEIKEANILAYFYSPNRLKEFCCLTSFIRSPDGISVKKERLVKAEGMAAITIKVADSLTIKFFHKVPRSERYILGESLLIMLLRFVRRGDVVGSMNLIYSWAKFVTQSFDIRYKDDKKDFNSLRNTKIIDVGIEGGAFDVNPTNIIVQNGRLIGIDMEWEAEGFVPLGWVLWRGLGAAYSNPGLDQIQPNLNSIFLNLVDLLGLDCTIEELSHFQSMEARFGACLSRYERSDSVQIKLMKLK